MVRLVQLTADRAAVVMATGSSHPIGHIRRLPGWSAASVRHAKRTAHVLHDAEERSLHVPRALEETHQNVCR